MKGALMRYIYRKVWRHNGKFISMREARRHPETCISIRFHRLPSTFDLTLSIRFVVRIRYRRLYVVRAASEITRMVIAGRICVRRGLLQIGAIDLGNAHEVSTNPTKIGFTRPDIFDYTVTVCTWEIARLALSKYTKTVASI